MGGKLLSKADLGIEKFRKYLGDLFAPMLPSGNIPENPPENTPYVPGRELKPCPFRIEFRGTVNRRVGHGDCDACGADVVLPNELCDECKGSGDAVNETA